MNPSAAKKPSTSKILIFLFCAGVLFIGVGVLLNFVQGDPHHSPKFACWHDLKTIESAVDMFKTNYARYPIGTNSQVLHLLQGDNPKRVVFLNVPIKNGTNHFFDPWGSDYKIEVSEERIHLQSAGPNKVFGDSDDFVFEKKFK